MIETSSPWLAQVPRNREFSALENDTTADVAVVGGGIAGIATAYFILRNTDKSVLLLEAEKIAHGATGHNAGQLVSYFEKPFHEIVAEFGLDMAAEGLRSVHSAWDLLDQIYADAHIKTPVTKFIGYAGCTSFAQVIPHLENNALRKKAGLPPHPIYVSAQTPHLSEIPQEYHGLYEVIPAEEILDLLETTNTAFVAALGSMKGCLNSAAFTQELAEYLAKHYAQRLRIAENTPVHVAELHVGSARLQTPHAIVDVSRVILCTNGFEYIKIENKGGSDIDTKFHHMVRGAIGYMAAYLDPQEGPQTAISYFPLGTTDDHAGEFDSDPYFYLTRRLYYTEDGKTPSLVCIGGPEVAVEDTTVYKKDHLYPEKAKKDIEDFLKKTYRRAISESAKRVFFWHGLMGYTPNGIRRVGAEPCNKVLLYNLGCNGVGILPSLYGAKRIAQILSQENLPASIFDPPDQRCELPPIK